MFLGQPVSSCCHNADSSGQAAHSFENSSNERARGSAERNATMLGSMAESVSSQAGKGMREKKSAVTFLDPGL